MFKNTIYGIAVSADGAIKHKGRIKRGLEVFGTVGKTLTVGKLIAENFIPNPMGYEYVSHKDGNPYNNTVENLMWVESKNSLKQPKNGWVCINKRYKLKTATTYYITPDGEIFSKKTSGEIKKITISLGQEAKVRLCKKTLRIHRIVAEVYLKAKGLKRVRHIDGNISNNTVENLEWY